MGQAGWGGCGEGGGAHKEVKHKTSQRLSIANLISNLHSSKKGERKTPRIVIQREKVQATIKIQPQEVPNAEPRTKIWTYDSTKKEKKQCLDELKNWTGDALLDFPS